MSALTPIYGLQGLSKATDRYLTLSGANRAGLIRACPSSLLGASTVKNRDRGHTTVLPPDLIHCLFSVESVLRGYLAGVTGRVSGGSASSAFSRRKNAPKAVATLLNIFVSAQFNCKSNFSGIGARGRNNAAVTAWTGNPRRHFIKK